MTAERPYSPETLAARWGCSAETVRQMFHRGDLAGFRLGKLIRIPANEVERIECQNTTSTGIAESESSNTGTVPDDEFVARLARQMKGSPKLALVNTGRQSPPHQRSG